MAPSRAQGVKKLKKNSNVFSASANVKETRRKNKSFGVKKAKDKVIPKKKLKDQTSRQIETVNDTFDELQSQIIVCTSLENSKISAYNKEKSHKEKVSDDLTVNCDVSEQQLGETIANIANL